MPADGPKTVSSISRRASTRGSPDLSLVGRVSDVPDAISRGKGQAEMEGENTMVASRLA